MRARNEATRTGLAWPRRSAAWGAFSIHWTWGKPPKVSILCGEGGNEQLEQLGRATPIPLSFFLSWPFSQSLENCFARSSLQSICSIMEDKLPCDTSFSSFFRTEKKVPSFWVCSKMSDDDDVLTGNRCQYFNFFLLIFKRFSVLDRI